MMPLLVYPSTEVQPPCLVLLGCAAQVSEEAFAPYYASFVPGIKGGYSPIAYIRPRSNVPFCSPLVCSPLICPPLFLSNMCPTNKFPSVMFPFNMSPCRVSSSNYCFICAPLMCLLVILPLPILPSLICTLSSFVTGTVTGTGTDTGTGIKSNQTKSNQTKPNQSDHS